jgi:phosphatidylserine/phosphatidylglycerophosphate/cardiolipin synthase-like enzyme
MQVNLTIREDFMDRVHIEGYNLSRYFKETKSDVIDRIQLAWDKDQYSVLRPYLRYATEIRGCRNRYFQKYRHIKTRIVDKYLCFK